MKINIYKIKKGKEALLKEWGVSIHANTEEALASLIEENCLAESMKMFSINGEIYIVGVMCVEKGKEILPYNPERKINKEHFKILKEAIVGQVKLEDIYTLAVD